MEFTVNPHINNLNRVGDTAVTILYLNAVVVNVILMNISHIFFLFFTSKYTNKNLYKSRLFLKNLRWENKSNKRMKKPTASE
tara:strand:- start:562 stop:807 length:246 start_codon:yes stop_codon:yes gene_type:complete